MDLITGAALAAAALFGLKALGKPKAKPGEVKPEAVSTGFEPFAPDLQAAAWYNATSLQWSFTGELGDNTGRRAITYRGKAQGDPAKNRPANDATFRKAMADGFRVVVSEYLPVAAGMGMGPGVPYLLLVPDAFNRASVPSDWGTLRQLYAPPPGSFGAPLPSAEVLPGYGPTPGPGGPGTVPGVPTGDPYAEITDPVLRAKVRELAGGDEASLLALDATAKELDKAGYAASAAALRRRRDDLVLRRSIEAKERGGWLYVVRSGDLPWRVAQHYGGIKPGVIGELSKANPDVSANNWRGWHPGVEVLLPGKWPDPSFKPLPPLAVGKPDVSTAVPSKPKPTAPGVPGAPSGPVAGTWQFDPVTGRPIFPGSYIDPGTGLPVAQPSAFPWADPQKPWGAAGPPGTPLPGGGMAPGATAAFEPNIEPGEVPLVGGAIRSLFGGEP